MSGIRHVPPGSTLYRGFTSDSLENRIRQFFLNNPDEELSYIDMAVKFGCSRDSARNAVAELRKGGLLESLHIVRVPAHKRAVAA